VWVIRSDLKSKSERFEYLYSAMRIPKSEFDLAAAFAEKDNLDGFQEDEDFQKGRT
jgi:hypothetical protein